MVRDPVQWQVPDVLFGFATREFGVGQPHEQQEVELFTVVILFPPPV